MYIRLPVSVTCYLLFAPYSKLLKACGNVDQPLIYTAMFYYKYKL